jgi:hypothetical protein
LARYYLITTVNESTVELFDPKGSKPDIDVSKEFGDTAIRITPKRNLRFLAPSMLHTCAKRIKADYQQLQAYDLVRTV